ncbi:hypothetical protein DIE04_19000 [Burkholderia sp. Bp8994]|uniref:hypothetical protein n=1 Tax=Burkholderia sp. Bp8994 TaxID=2184555 RepID=UPI000F5A4061|nr:hypothetical protein [Burkholderia sp. Bp8994]RQR94544.1 hypothetical protein DIE04_19000 [Burkholderia sp. Bp8994]
MDKRPSLTADRWVAVDEPEFIRVRTGTINEIARASRAIAAIGRILHNSISDDDDGIEIASLDNWTKQNLAGAVECLSDFIYDFVEDAGYTGRAEAHGTREDRHD